MRKILFPILLAIVAGCSEQAPIEPLAEQPQRPITFVWPDSAGSRGHVTNSLNMQSFAVSATVYSPTGDRSLYFAHEQYNCNYIGQDLYRTVTGNVHYWLSPDDEYNFFAYTPSQYIYFERGVVDKFIYTTPKDVLKHPDLLVATSIAAEYGVPVELNFTHPLAQISISEGTMMRHGRIISISFSGIIDHGEYNMLTGEWMMLSSDTDTFVWECNVLTHSDTNLSGEYFNFFFVPQQLGANAAMTIAFENALGTIELHRVQLSGSWNAGHHYRYVISM